METLIFVCFGDSFERRRRDSAVFRHDRSVRPTNIIHTCSRSRPASTRNSSFSCAYSYNNSFGVYKTHKKFCECLFSFAFSKEIIARVGGKKRDLPYINKPQTRRHSGPASTCSFQDILIRRQSASDDGIGVHSLIVFCFVFLRVFR